MNEKFAPWDADEAVEWLGTLPYWKRMLKLVRKTLEKEPRNYPHQIRAAAAFVIMVCRQGLWPVDSVRELDSIVDLARRQLTIVRQMYALEGRNNKKLMANMKFKTLLKSIEEEIRILDSRLADERGTMPNKPPCSWGEFLGKRGKRPDELR